MDKINKLECALKAVGRATKIEFNGIMNYTMIVGLGSKYVEGQISGELLFSLETKEEIISFFKNFENRLLTEYIMMISSNNTN